MQQVLGEDEDVAGVVVRCSSAKQDADDVLASRRPATPGAAAPSTGPVHDMWGRWLDVVADDDGSGADDAHGAEPPPRSALHILLQGGEVLRSFLQFILRSAEPHRGQQEHVAIRRSFAAARLALRSFTDLGFSPTDGAAVGGAPIGTCGGLSVDGMRALGVVCCELLGGLQPGSTCCSLHICAALQFFAGAHDPEIPSLLLQRHAPFVLLRGLDRLGCKELLLGMLLGCDNVALPQLMPGHSAKPVSATTVHKVMQYLRMTDWPNFLCAVLEQGVKAVDERGVSGSIQPVLGHPVRRLSPPRQRSVVQPGSPGPLTPIRVNRMSPGPATPGLNFGTTPQRKSATPVAEGATPQRASTPLTEASPLRTLELVPSSPSPSCVTKPLHFTGVPAFPMEQRRIDAFETLSSPMPSALPEPSMQAQHPMQFRQPMQNGRAAPSSQAASIASPARQLAQTSATSAAYAVAESMAAASPSRTLSASSAALAQGDGEGKGGQKNGEAIQSAVGSPICHTGAALCSQSGGSSSSTDSGVNHEGVGLLVDFLASALAICGRQAEALARQARASGGHTCLDTSAHAYVEAQAQFLQMVFLDTPLISNLFRLLKGDSGAEHESASLLHALLKDTLNPLRHLSCKAEAVLALFLPHVETLGSILTSTAPPEAQQQRRRQQQQSQHPLQPLGALRSAVVQILSVLCDLAPERTLPLVKPHVWAVLVTWFLLHRCNHIFQAACGRIFVQVVEHGSHWLHQLVFSRHRLLRGLCDIVLAEGACGDSWHELRPRTSAAGTDASARVEKSQVAVRRKRHPGGLGGVLPVLRALAAFVRKDTAKAEAVQVPVALERRPLGELQRVQLQAHHTDKILTKPCPPPAPQPPSYLVRLVGMTPHWTEVLGALGRPAVGPSTGASDSFAPTVPPAIGGVTRRRHCPASAPPRSGTEGAMDAPYVQHPPTLLVQV